MFHLLSAVAFLYVCVCIKLSVCACAHAMCERASWGSVLNFMALADKDIHRLSLSISGKVMTAAGTYSIFTFNTLSLNTSALFIASLKSNTKSRMLIPIVKIILSMQLLLKGHHTECVL